MIIGITLIAAVSTAGFIGFYLIVAGGQDSYGLPNNWSNAPLTSTITVKNDTDMVSITVSQILEGVKLWKEQEHQGVDLHEDKDVVGLFKIHDSTLDKDITGVNVLDVLELADNYFAWGLEFISSEHESIDPIETSTGQIIDEVESESDVQPIIALAIDGQWISQSSYADQWGPISIYTKDSSTRVYNLDTIKIKDYWTVDVIVNGKVEYTVTYENIRINAKSQTYEYYRDDYWTFNRSYYGKSVYDIIQQTSAKNYNNWQVKITCADGLITPSPYSNEKPYSKSEIANGLPNDGERIIPRSEDDYVNKTNKREGVGLLKTDNIMYLTFKQKQYREGNPAADIWDPAWNKPIFNGYSHGPFAVVIPGRTRGNYPRYVTQISITAS